MTDHNITTPDDAQKFFSDARAAIIASDDREQAWLDCAATTGQKVRAKELGRAYAADELRQIAVEQLFDLTEDQIQSALSTAFRPAEREAQVTNGHSVEPPPATSPDEFGVASAAAGAEPIATATF